MAYEVGGVFFDLGVNLKNFEKQLDKAFSIAKKKGAGLVWDTSSFVAGIKMTKKEFKAFSNEVSKARDKYEELLDLQKGLQSSDLWGQLGDQARSAVEDAVSLAKAEADLYKRTKRFMGLGRGVKTIFGGLGKVFSGVFSIFRRHTAKAGAEFSGFLKRLIGIAGVAALLRKAFSYAREGMENLIKADANTANSVATLRSALMSLKNAFAAAFAPILNAVAPILTKFIGMLTSAANAVASFISALTGKKFAVVATSVADGIGGIGDSASGANDSAKELQRTLMGFDKINKLDSNSGSGSGGGGGGGGAGGGGGFDVVPVGDEANKWADKFRESWENADFYWLGELLANKMNDALEKIPWDKIQNGARKLAGSLATFLNGFIENADWDLVGETIANGLNTAVYFAQTFVHTFNWGALGDAIAGAINGFVKKTDWSAIGDTIGTAIYGLLTTINNFLKGTDWSAIGSAIVEMIASINWVNLFKGAVELIGNIAGAIFDMMSGAITTAKDKLKKWIDSGKIWDDLFEIGSKVIEVGISLFKKGWTTLKDFVGALVEVGIALVKSGWTALSTFVGNTVSVLITLAKSGWSTISTYIGSTANVLITLGKSGWSTISAYIGNTANVLITIGKSGWSAFTDLLFGSGVTEGKAKVGIELKKLFTTIAEFLFGKGKTEGSETVNVSGTLTDVTKAKDFNSTIGGMKASFRYRTKHKKFNSTLGDMKASFRYRTKGKGFNSTIDNMTAKVTKVDFSAKAKQDLDTHLSGSGHAVRAEGGVYKNGKWSAIQKYASGGLPNGSQLFWAREAGPELVGTLGGHTAVMNNDQIVASVSSGVAKAIAGIRFKMSAPPLAVTSKSASNSNSAESTDNREMINLLTQILKAINAQDTNVYLDGEAIKNNVVSRINNHTRRTGQLELIV